jgi:Fic family protein
LGESSLKCPCDSKKRNCLPMACHHTPFEDGNGRLSRALSDLIISSEWKDLRTFSISSAIPRRKNEYYDELYKLQHGSSMDITSYIAWYIDLVTKAMETAALSCKSKIRLLSVHAQLGPI